MSKRSLVLPAFGGHLSKVLMSAFGGRVPFAREIGRHKKARYKTGLCFFGSGGVIALAPLGLSYVGRLRRPRNEPAPSSRDPLLFGSGGTFEEIWHLYAKPFPLVA